jgi:hypothetical protein
MQVNSTTMKHGRLRPRFGVSVSLARPLLRSQRLFSALSNSGDDLRVWAMLSSYKMRAATASYIAFERLSEFESVPTTCALFPSSRIGPLEQIPLHQITNNLQSTPKRKASSGANPSIMSHFPHGPRNSAKLPASSRITSPLFVLTKMRASTASQARRVRTRITAPPKPPRTCDGPTRPCRWVSISWRWAYILRASGQEHPSSLCSRTAPSLF